jgi:hypothetical protein
LDGTKAANSSPNRGGRQQEPFYAVTTPEEMHEGEVMTDVQITLTSDERQYLLRVVEHALGESRVEVRRTHSPDFRERVLDEEQLQRGLLLKLEKSK